MKRIFSLIALCALTSLHSAEGKPLKVFILAGQSNMEGHAKVETFDSIGDDPATALLKPYEAGDRKIEDRKTGGAGFAGNFPVLNFSVATMSTTRPRLSP